MRNAATSTITGPLPLPTKRFASGLAIGVARLAWLLGLPGRIAMARRDMAVLCGMSARELADIGLSRQDVRDAAAVPFGTDPGPLLTCRVAERRRAALSRRG